MADPGVPVDYLRAKGNRVLLHVRPLDAGGSGEVHAVPTSLLVLLTPQIRDAQTGKVSPLYPSLKSPNTFEKVFARKIMQVTGLFNEDDIKNEMRAVSKLCMVERTHSNIVSVFDYGRLSPFRYFVDMEICDFNLESWIYGKWSPVEIKNLPSYLTGELPARMRIGQVWDIMEDITRAVAFIHSEKEVHRDLKPRNSTPPQAVCQTTHE